MIYSPFPPLKKYKFNNFQNHKNILKHKNYIHLVINFFEKTTWLLILFQPQYRNVHFRIIFNLFFRIQNSESLIES